MTECVDSVTLERLKYAATHRVSKELWSAALEQSRFKVSEAVSWLFDDICLQMAAHLWAQEIDKAEAVVRYPRTWWDAFKLAYFPAFMRRWFPAKHTEERVTLKRFVGFPNLPHYPADWGKPVIKEMVWKHDVMGGRQ